MQTEVTSKQNTPRYARESESLAFARHVLIATLVVASVLLVLLFVVRGVDARLRGRAHLDFAVRPSPAANVFTKFGLLWSGLVFTGLLYDRGLLIDRYAVFENRDGVGRDRDCPAV